MFQKIRAILTRDFKCDCPHVKLNVGSAFEKVPRKWTIAGTAAPSIVFDPVCVEAYLVAPDPGGFGEGKTFREDD